MNQSTDGLQPSLQGERLFRYPPELDQEAVPTWWSRYSQRLSGLSVTATSVLEIDSRYIVDQGIFGAGQPGEPGWPDTRVRRGLVMGSVQSGKTASMFGVTSLSLDAGLDIVVILAGTRISLWQQTLGRFTQQVDWPIAGAIRESARLLIPKGGVDGVSEGRIPLSTLYRLEPARIRRALREHRPLVIVAMKHADHLRALSRSLRESVMPAVNRLGRQVHMLVLDDEADDGSVIDALVESSQRTEDASLKQIPRAIADLWEPRVGTVAPANFFATYVAYTATPQANFLQQDHNPLAPKDFVIALRTPYDSGQVEPRSTTYFEADGPNRYYTGGEIFYRRGRGANLVQATTNDPHLDIAEALRAYLVATAVRRLRSPEKLGPASAHGTVFATKDEAIERCPSPSSMLVHPSASVADQFGVLGDLLRRAGVQPPEDLSSWQARADDALPHFWAQSLRDDEVAWKVWLDRFATSAEELRSIFGRPRARTLPPWEDVRRELLEEVFPGTRVSVVNSDPNADDRPEYEPIVTDEGWRAPRDLSTVFISGNVMSRGLTLEGLTTTVFLRRADTPFADTQMQMQRWFGYRGSYLELCRVFASHEQLEYFANYHEADEALRQGVVASMAADPERAPSPQVLQGAGYLATGKIANLRNQPLCPGATPFIRLINEGRAPDPNAALVASLFRDSPSTDVTGTGAGSRGRILDQPMTLAKAAEVLDSLRFDGYAPGTDTWQGSMWSHARNLVDAQGELADARPLYRAPPPPEDRAPDEVRRDCPYAIGAYLRLWEGCLTRHVRGMFPTDGPSRRWSMVDLAARSRQAPRFWVGIRYGAGQVVREGPLGGLPFAIRATERSTDGGRINTTWGTRNPNARVGDYRGDEFFDYFFRGTQPPPFVEGEPSWRPVGADGLILFYVNQQPGQQHAAVATGVCIPLGGPDQFAAVVTTALGGAQGVNV